VFDSLVFRHINLPQGGPIKTWAIFWPPLYLENVHGRNAEKNMPEMEIYVAEAQVNLSIPVGIG
jgi:hypothetical protein